MLLTLRTAEPHETSFAPAQGTEPAAVLTVELPGGRAHLFRPSPPVVAVMLELDPTPRVRNPGDTHALPVGGALMGLALHQLSPAILSLNADISNLIEARLSALWCPAGTAMLTRFFGPLGYTVDATQLALDLEQPQVGHSPFYSVGLSAHQRPREVLSHLCVLLPLFDNRLHKRSNRDTERLWAEARGWLETHPEHEVLKRRLLGRAPGSRHHEGRHDAVLGALRDSGARRVLDLGCGSGTLLHRLLEEPQFEEVLGVEVARDELAEAASKLAPSGRGRVLHGSLAYHDKRLTGFDAAILVEVIEHMDPPQLAAVEGAVWETARPATVVVTTPNAEYNTLFEYHRGGRLRHPDHRFEWTRAEFGEWAHRVAHKHGYAVRFTAVGAQDPRVGPVTQMAVFERLAEAPPPERATGPREGLSGRDAKIHLGDVAGERTISTRLGGGVHVQAAEAAAALEVMSRFAVDARWLIYLPPTTPAAVTSPGSDALEHPLSALAYYQNLGLTRVALQEMHTGIHVVAVICRDAEVARRRFGVANGGTGVVYSATGQPFFATRAAEETFLVRLRDALGEGGVWEQLATDWIALEGVIGPGVPQMREANMRLRPPVALYRAAATAAFITLEEAEAVLSRAAAAGVNTMPLLDRTRQRAALVTAYSAACRRGFHAVRTLDDLRLAPVRLLAAEGAVYAERDLRWHRELMACACEGAPQTLLETEQTVIALADPAAASAAVAWWDTQVAQGGTGIVVRPLEGGWDGETRLLAPAMKCRSEDALRMVHGPEPILPEQRDQVRGPTIAEAASQAAREWGLSIEALERFVRGEPTARVHECVFGALAIKLGSRE